MPIVFIGLGMANKLAMPMLTTKVLLDMVTTMTTAPAIETILSKNNLPLLLMASYF
jgi:hypothetical protein